MWHNTLQGSFINEKCFNFSVVLDPVHLLDVYVQVASHPRLLELVEVAAQLLQVVSDVQPNVQIVGLCRYRVVSVSKVLKFHIKVMIFTST